MYVCVYAHTHTQCTDGVLSCEPRSRDEPRRHLEIRKNPDRLKRSIHVDRIGVQSTFVYIYAGLQVLMMWADCFFLLTRLFNLEK